MSLFLIESSFEGKVNEVNEFNALVASLRETVAAKDVKLLEVQVSKGFDRAFFIFEGSESDIRASLEDAQVSILLLKEVRLIGKQQEEVGASDEGLNYLVEWNLPEHLTMEQYLERKRNNSVHYAEVPEVSFSRTYVCEDMTKCLCFYNAPDEAAVKRAREAVKAPIDAITEILPKE
ncbi:DUF4242 domain-containing protein [Paenibacillus sp. IITD108]|uniref:DUF4242 domain-containing protein n=1 Tax=Paenibacillus sp. IITD108 TaxID=3116649 RepID=UPI002F3F2078